MKVFISQPMRDKTEQEIKNERVIALADLQELYPDKDIEIINSYIEDEPKSKNKALWCLGRSLQLMAEADAVYFVDGWKNARGCAVEFKAALEYGLVVMANEKDDLEWYYALKRLKKTENS